MAINPELITTIRVDQLPDETLSLTNLFPHTVGTDLKSATIQELVDLVATAIGVSGGVGYIAISVTDGQQLPDVPELPSFFLCGAGTFLNINGYPNIICTENLNAIMSLTDHWELAVEIPINPLSGTVESVTGSAVDNTDPLNPVINITGGSQTLAEVLVEGNITDGTDISISDGDKIVLDNGANLKKGTTDAGLGGTKGIALRCAVDYELKWEAGRLYVMGGDGFTIREVSHNFTTTPTVNDDDTKGFVVDSRWILDNGDLYVCTDDTTGAAVWVLQGSGAVPTLDQVLTEGNTSSTEIVIGTDFDNGLSLNTQYANLQETAATYIKQIGFGVDNFYSLFDDLSTGDNYGAFLSPTEGLSLQTFGSGGYAKLKSDLVTTVERTIQFPDASGTLALKSDIPSGGGGASVSFYLNGSVSQGTIGGVAFKEMDRTPILGAGTDFTINADGYIQSFITDANVPNQLEIPAGNWNFETYFSASSGGGSPSFYIELYKWNGTTLSLIASNSATPRLITDGTNIEAYFSALAVPQTTLLATDRLAVRIYVNHSGRTITLHTENSHLCQVITTFTTGLTALNGLTQQVQNLAVGTSGTDFAISSITDTHTFNLPTASASNRGALSSTDWTTFNNKQNSLGFTPYKFIQTSQTAHTGTTAETILATATIAGGTFNSSDVMKVIWQLIRPSGGSSGGTFRLKINTSNTLTGATSIAQNTLTTFPFQGTGIRTFTLQGGNLIGYPPGQNAFTDFGVINFTGINTTYNTANTLYVFFTLQLVSSSDSVTLTLANITN
jgi:hypothetical protein